MLLALHLLLLAPASAEPSWLRWQAPAECPDIHGAVRATSDRLGREPLADEVQVVGVIEATEGGHHLRLDVDVDGDRESIELVSPDCGSLVDAAGLVIATHIDPTLSGLESEPPAPDPPPSIPEPQPEPEPKEPEIARSDARPAPASTPVASPSPPSDTPHRGPEALTLSALGGADLGTLPRMTGGPRLRVELLWSWWRLGVAGTYLAPRVFTNDAGQARVQAALADVRACGRVRWRRTELPLCGSLEVGGTHAQGRRDPGRRSARGPRMAVAASAVPRVRVWARVGLVANLEVAYAPIRTAYVVRDPGDAAVVFSPPAFSGRAWLGIEVILRTWR